MHGTTGRSDTSEKRLEAGKGDDEDNEAASDLGGCATGVPEEWVR